MMSTIFDIKELCAKIVFFSKEMGTVLNSLYCLNQIGYKDLIKWIDNPLNISINLLEVVTTNYLCQGFEGKVYQSSDFHL